MFARSLCTGWVDTDMGRRGGKAPVTAPDSVRGILKTWKETTIDESGAFKDWNGKVLPL